LDDWKWKGKGEGEGKEGQDPDRVRDTDIIAGDRSEYLRYRRVGDVHTHYLRYVCVWRMTREMREDGKGSLQQGFRGRLT